MTELLWLAVAAVVVLLGVVLGFVVRGERRLGTPAQRAGYATLRTANLLAPSLRSGLHGAGSGKVTTHLQSLLGTPGVVLADVAGVIAVAGVDEVHQALLEGPIARVVTTGEPQVLAAADLVCARGATCALQAAVVAPLAVDGTVVGALVAAGPSAPAGLLRLASEVAQFIATQLELAELDRSRRRAAQAELRFLRAQISPHFIYNAITAIESFVRTDPDRARELLVQFADFTRYSFRGRDQFVTVAEELRLVDTYLELERARFGERLAVTLRVAPEVLSVRVPSLILQPLVENAVRHGLEPSGRAGHLSIAAHDAGSDAVITVEDDGAGADPERVRRVLSGREDGDAVGLHNVDERLRAVFGEQFGLVVETRIDAGTKVTVRIPKYQVAVPAS
ncbi:MAG: histidine kinase [Actinomycetota bacterium]|nr:histidine kinase [Actinomycetota bacterium]